MNVHDMLHSIMTSVISCCQCVQVLPLSPRQPGVTKVLPLSPGRAGLGWAGSELSPASQCPAQASQDGGSVMAQRGAESSSVVSLIWTLHSDMLHNTRTHCPPVLLTTTRYSRVSISSTAGDTAQVSSVLSPEPRWHGHNKAQAAE